MAMLLYRHLSRPDEAITRMEQAIAVLVETGLPQNAAGATVEQLQNRLAAMRSDATIGAASSPATIPAEQIQTIATNTVAMMTGAQDRRDEWREAMAGALQQAQQQGDDWQSEVEFFTAVLDILDGQTPELPGDHPYTQSLAPSSPSYPRAIKDSMRGSAGTRTKHPLIRFGEANPLTTPHDIRTDGPAGGTRSRRLRAFRRRSKFEFTEKRWTGAGHLQKGTCLRLKSARIA